MDLIDDLGRGLLSGAAYAAVGLVLLAIGYVVIDLLTPGKLNQLIYADRNRNAAAVVCSGLLAVAAIVVTAILTSEDRLAEGLLSSAGYGLLGILLLAVCFEVIDRLTPGDLGVICTDREPHPAIWITVASQIAVGAIVAAAIS